MILRRHLIILVTGIVAVVVFSCNSTPPRSKEKPHSEGIYLDYRAWGDEETGTVTVRLQYRSGGPEADPILLSAPAQVEWDGVRLSPDSSRMNGVYYEKTLPLQAFGDHLVKFTDENGKSYETKIDFPFISLTNEIPSVVGRKDLVLTLAGVKDKDDLQVLLTDTSFYGRGIDRVYIVEKDRLVIPRSHLARLKKGPVYLEIIRDEDRVMEHTPPGGGILSLSYAIKREFVLSDSL